MLTCHDENELKNLDISPIIYTVVLTILLTHSTNPIWSKSSYLYFFSKHVPKTSFWIYFRNADKLKEYYLNIRYSFRENWIFQFHQSIFLYSHLADELNIEISAVGVPAEAHARMAYAMAELRKYLVPDNSDYISIEQLEEMERMREQGGNFQERGIYIC